SVASRMMNAGAEFAGEMMSPVSVEGGLAAARYGVRGVDTIHASIAPGTPKEGAEEPSPEPELGVEPQPAAKPALEGAAPSKQEEKEKKKVDPCAEDVSSAEPQATSWYAMDVGEGAFTFSISGPQKRITIRDAGVSGRRGKTVASKSDYPAIS